MNKGADYLKYLKQETDKKAVLFEAGQGKHINGNAFALLRCLETDGRWSDHTSYVSIRKENMEDAKAKLKKYDLKDVRLVLRDSSEYRKLLATAGYLITDNSFFRYFVKRDDQVYLNTWHGTPLKRLGRSDIANSASIGNVQKNFLSADYLLHPNDYTREIMMKDYMVDRTFTGQIITTGYPRNDALFSNFKADEIREKHALEDKKVLAYMPTWRGTGRKADESRQNQEAIEAIRCIEKNLKDNEILYVNFHFIVQSSVDFSQFEKVRPFPAEYETYDFLAVCDTLITDYSSVAMDFAQTGRPVILYMYDYEQYCAEKGFYFDIRELPFAKAYTAEELADVMNAAPQTYKLDDIYVEANRGCASVKVLELMIGGRNTGLQLTECSDMQKQEIVYAGNLENEKNRKKASAYLNGLSADEKQHVVLAFANEIKEDTAEFLSRLDEDIRYMRFIDGGFRSMKERICLRLYRKYGACANGAGAYYAREEKRKLGNCAFAKITPLTEWPDSEIRAQLGHTHYDCTGDSIVISGSVTLISRRENTEPEGHIRIGSVLYDQYRSYEISVKKQSVRNKKHTSRIKFSFEAVIDQSEINNWYPDNRMHISVKAGGEEYYVPLRSPRRTSPFKNVVVYAEKAKTVCFFKESLKFFRILVRQRNVTDSVWQRAKIAFAYACHRITPWYRPVVFFEKFSTRYEESASVLFEKLIDMGHRNARFILDGGYPHMNRVADKYRKYLVKQFSLAHYYNLFAAKTLISTEVIEHSLEKRTASRIYEKYKMRGDQDYIFLQHGVMYMVSLDSEQRDFYGRSKGKGRKRVVVSSQLEAQHFLDKTAYRPSELYITGLAKFDRSVLDDDADRIVIMPTWRPWEYVKAFGNEDETGYYRMIKMMTESVPEELADKVIVLTHPRMSGHTDRDESYDDILKKTKLLITDYSSISYDAFYRGANVVFYWGEKDECMTHYGKSAKLMLTEDSAFGKVCYNKKSLSEAIAQSYYRGQSESDIMNYRKIVEFHDGRNTERIYDKARSEGMI